MTILLPAGLGLAIGVILISFIMNKLIKNYYTATFSIIFGLFLAIVPNVLTESCALGFNIQSVVSIIICIVSFVFSIVFENIGSFKEIKIINSIIEKFSKIFKIKNKESEKVN